MEIIPTIYVKSAISAENPKGIVKNHIDFFYQKTGELPFKMIVREIFGDKIINTES
jgi:hypothetical protein